MVVVDNDTDVAMLIRLLLDYAGVDNVTLLSDVEASHLGPAWKEYEIAVIDWSMPVHSGAEIVAYAKRENPRLRCAIFSAYAGHPLQRAVFGDFAVRHPDVPIIAKTDIDEFRDWVCAGNR